MSFVNPKENVVHLGLKEGMMVADFGAGSGENTIKAGEMVGTSGTVYAIDIQKDILGAIEGRAEENNLSNIKTIWGDLEESGGSKLRDSSLDAVILSNILFQAEHKDVLAKEVARTLKPGGRVLVVDWTDSFSNFGPRKEDIFTEGDTRKLMEQAGFSHKESFNAGDYHYGAVFVK